MRAMLAMMFALPSIAPASTLTIVHQSIPVDLKQRSKLITSTLDASANQTGYEIVHQSIPVDLEPRSRLNTQSCDKKCDMTFKPVCDSYGDTHGNKCAFEIAACKAKKKKLTIVEEGVCGGCSKYEYKRKRCITDFYKGRIHVALAKPRFTPMQHEDPLILLSALNTVSRLCLGAHVREEFRRFSSSLQKHRYGPNHGEDSQNPR